MLHTGVVLKNQIISLPSGGEVVRSIFDVHEPSEEDGQLPSDATLCGWFYYSSADGIHTPVFYSASWRTWFFIAEFQPKIA